jgi:hypothetical protein
MPETARLLLCARCRAQGVICGRCDRGNRYCGRDCAQAARRAGLRAAGARDPHSRRGRFAHAARQRHYRRARAKVTHQGSAPPPPGDPLPPASRHPDALLPPVAQPGGGVKGHFCHGPCSPFLRLDFCRGVSRRPFPWIDLPPPARGP